MSWAKAILAAGLCFLSALTVAAGTRSAGANVDELSRLSAAATKTYVSPHGSGQRNGISPDNAYGFSSLTRHLRNLKASTTLYFAPGIYHLRNTLSLTAPANGVLHVKGAPGVVFQGDFQFGEDNHEASGVRLGSGDIILENIKFDHTRNCVRVDQRHSVTNVYLRQIEARDVRSCIKTYRNSRAEVRHWTIDGLKVRGYYLAGIRLAGKNTSDIRLENIDLDGEHQLGPNDCYKGGIQLLAGVSHVVISKARIVNNIGDCEAFQQGDGIEADDKGGTPEDIVILDTYVANSGDANLDLKADSVVMRRVEADGGQGSHYNYKLWNYNHYLCITCQGRGKVRSRVILFSARAVFRDPSFTNTRSARLCELRRKKGPSELIVKEDGNLTGAKHLSCASEK